LGGPRCVHVSEASCPTIWHKAAAGFRPGGSNGRGGRIPQPLWDLAVRLVRKHGLSRTATALGLDYYSLKKRVEAAGQGPPSPSPAFVELPAPLVVSKQALFELDNGTGASRRLQLLGYDAAEVAALARHFWNAE
jgi:hypothetical protein